MSDFDIVVEFPDFAIEALRRGEWVVLKLKDDLYCKVMPYPIDEQLSDEFDEKEVVFKFNPRKTPQD